MKLLYFAQGHYLAMVGRPLFQEPMKAYEHGPAVTKVMEEWASVPDSRGALSVYLQAFLDEILGYYMARLTPAN